MPRKCPWLVPESIGENQKALIEQNESIKEVTGGGNISGSVGEGEDRCLTGWQQGEKL